MGSLQMLVIVHWTAYWRFRNSWSAVARVSLFYCLCSFLICVV